jgi:hypothetical protein
LRQIIVDVVHCETLNRRWALLLTQRLWRPVAARLMKALKGRAASFFREYHS